MVEYVIKAALGEDCSGLHMAPVKGCWSNYMVHSKTTGSFAGFEIAPEFREKHLVELVTDIKHGDSVHEFRDAQDSVAEALIKYENPTQMMELIPILENYIRVIVQ